MWYLSKMAKTFRDCILSSNSSMVIDSRYSSEPSTWSDKVIDSGEAVGEARLVAAGTGVAGGGVE